MDTRRLPFMLIAAAIQNMQPDYCQQAFGQANSETMRILNIRFLNRLKAELTEQYECF